MNKSNAMYSVFVLICALCACSANNLFDDALYRDALDPELCGRQLRAMRWFEFYDASFRIPEGLLGGNLASLGNYHQCLAINQDFPGTNIQGKYCLIQAPMTSTVRIPSLIGVSELENVTWTEVTLPEDQMQKYAGKSLSLAVCVPKSCSVAAVLARYTEHPVVRFNYTEQYCRLPDDKPFVAADYVAISFFSLLGVLTLISTAYELRHVFILRKDPEEASEMFCTFSLYTNTSRLLAVGKPGMLDCLDGIRSLSMLWIIILHTYADNFFVSKYVANPFDMLEWQYKKRALWLMSGDIAVDSFLTLSGLLLVYTSAKKMKQMSLLRNLHLFYLNRYLRLFPLLATAVLLQASIMHRVSDGPHWHREAAEVGQCRRYWWKALLYVQNAYANGFERCLMPSWYLSLDMQLYIISPLVLYWVLGSRRAACAALALAILASLAGTIAFCFIYDFPILLVAHRAQLDPLLLYKYMLLFYQNTVTRSTPFFIGMLFGYILHCFRGQKVKLSQWLVFPCHTLALGIFIYAIFIVHPGMQAHWDNQFSDSMNNSFRRPCWALALCWLIFACVHDYGGPVNWLLSLRLWKFVSRISYAMYLLHSPIQQSGANATVAPVYFKMETMLSLFASDLVYTVVLSTAACVLVEEPALTLQRIFLQSSPSKPQEHKGGNKPVSNPEENINENC